MKVINLKKLTNGQMDKKIYIILYELKYPSLISYTLFGLLKLNYWLIYNKDP